jgi:curved DNA-binding protein CbpA
LALHPDRHDGCLDKTKAFKEASEAYSILVNNERRQQYDMATGWAGTSGAPPPGWYNKNRKRAPPSNYRKVYAPHAPLDGKWHDAQRHYDMHYGDGMRREEMKRAYDGAKLRGEFEYHSPLGKGFSFANNSSSTSSADDNAFNPFSKAEQGPSPAPQFHYQESYIAEAKTVLKIKKNVVDRLHERRDKRIMEEEQQQQQEPPAHNKGAGPRHYTPYNQAKAECTIM